MYLSSFSKSFLNFSLYLSGFSNFSKRLFNSSNSLLRSASWDSYLLFCLLSCCLNECLILSSFEIVFKSTFCGLSALSFSPPFVFCRGFYSWLFVQGFRFVFCLDFVCDFIQITHLICSLMSFGIRRTLPVLWFVRISNYSNRLDLG